MTFLLAPMLGSLVLVPLLLIAYLALSRRRARRVEELAQLGFAPTAATIRLRKKRHVPYMFFFVGLTTLLVALARPATTLSVRSREGTVILAFDVSNSMRAGDLKPTRMEAAKAAARVFVEKQPSAIKIGVVAFNDGGVVTQQPTKKKAEVLAAIDRLTPGGGTSLGQGIFSSLNAIAGKALTVDPTKLVEGPDGAEFDIGFYGSASVILLSDGENRGEPQPADVARLASVAGVKIHTIGVGSPGGTTVKIDGFNVATALDETSLREIANLSDGKYFSAEDSASLTSVYKSIDLKWKSVQQDSEITGILSAGSIFLLLIGSTLSMFWFGKVV